MQMVTDKWGWTKIADHEYDTPCGLIDLTRDGKASLDTAMQDAWLSTLWPRDRRTADAETQQMLRTCRPHLGAIKRGLKWAARLING